MNLTHVLFCKMDSHPLSFENRVVCCGSGCGMGASEWNGKGSLPTGVGADGWVGQLFMEPPVRTFPVVKAAATASDGKSGGENNTETL